MKKPSKLHVSAGFRDFVLDQLAGMRDLRPQPMFGGIGLYAGDIFFGIIAADVLYFKIDDTTRPDYEAGGSHPFAPFPGRPTTMGYYSVPTSILEDPAALAKWALRAVRAAGDSTRAGKTRRKGGKR